jgi:hypothetical protein
VVLAGRGGAVEPPRKSSPSNESRVFVVLGPASSDLGATLAVGGPAVLEREGTGSSPPIKSASGAGI